MSVDSKHFDYGAAESTILSRIASAKESYSSRLTPVVSHGRDPSPKSSAGKSAREDRLAHVSEQTIPIHSKPFASPRWQIGKQQPLHTLRAQRWERIMRRRTSHLLALIENQAITQHHHGHSRCEMREGSSHGSPPKICRERLGTGAGDERAVKYAKANQTAPFSYGRSVRRIDAEPASMAAALPLSASGR